MKLAQIVVFVVILVLIYENGKNDGVTMSAAMIISLVLTAIITAPIVHFISWRLRRKERLAEAAIEERLGKQRSARVLRDVTPRH